MTICMTIYDRQLKLILVNRIYGINELLLQRALIYSDEELRVRSAISR